MWFKVAKVVIGDAVNMNGREELLRSHGIEVIVLNDPECIAMTTDFMRDNPEKMAGV